MPPAVVLGAGDQAHGIMEGQADNLDVEVNGVAGEVAFGPAPVNVFGDEAGIGGQNKFTRLAGDEFHRVQDKILIATQKWGTPARRVAAPAS